MNESLQTLQNFTSHFLQKICTTGDYILKLPKANKSEQLWSLQWSHFEQQRKLKLNVSWYWFIFCASSFMDKIIHEHKFVTFSLRY